MLVACRLLLPSSLFLLRFFIHSLPSLVLKTRHKWIWQHLHICNWRRLKVWRLLSEPHTGILLFKKLVRRLGPVLPQVQCKLGPQSSRRPSRESRRNNGCKPAVAQAPLSIASKTVKSSHL
ncbi:hypothetical protein B0H19DRAFT_480027 [Mycena capillaripes]|nr:hypothetical protein B0H19DRAFT_480027 [Mycena capillaripes]